MVRPLHSLLLFPRCHHFSPTRIKENSGWLFSCNVDTPKRMRGSRGKTFGWPPGRQVSKHSQEQKFNFCDGCRAYGPAEGCWGREATNPKPPKQKPETRNHRQKKHEMEFSRLIPSSHQRQTPEDSIPRFTSGIPAQSQGSRSSSMRQVLEHLTHSRQR